MQMELLFWFQQMEFHFQFKWCNISNVILIFRKWSVVCFTITYLQVYKGGSYYMSFSFLRFHTSLWKHISNHIFLVLSEKFTHYVFMYCCPRCSLFCVEISLYFKLVVEDVSSFKSHHLGCQNNLIFSNCVMCMLHAEHVSCVITDCGQHEWVIPSIFWIAL